MVKLYTLEQAKEWYYLYVKFGTAKEVLEYLIEGKNLRPSYKTLRKWIKDYENDLSQEEKEAIKRKISKEKENILDSLILLPDLFWNAFLKGDYPKKAIILDEIVAPYKDLILERGYLSSIQIKIDRQPICFINFIVLKGEFMIILTSVKVYKNNPNRRIIGYVSFNQISSKIKFNQDRLENHVFTKRILKKLEYELTRKGINISEFEAENPLLYKKDLKILLVSALWSFYIKKKLDTIEERANQIKDQLNLSLNTVCRYGVKSNNKEVRKEAHQVLYRLRLEDNLIKQPQFLNSEEHVLISQGLRSFDSFQNIKDDVNNEDIFADEFWDAFLNGKYPEENNEFIDFRLDRYTDLLEGLGYFKTLYRSGYVINIVSIKNVIFISLFTFGRHSRGSYSRLLGIIDYHPRRGKNYLDYYEKGTARDNPIALIILYKIRRDLLQKIEIDDVSRESGKMPYDGPLNIIACCRLWEKSFEEDNTLTVIERAEKIGAQLNLEPVTVAGYVSRFSFNKEVRIQANLASNNIMDSMHNITNTWEKMNHEFPKITSKEIVEQISVKEGVDPISIAGWARFSSNKMVKSESNKLVSKLMDEKNDITAQWQDLLKGRPNLPPEEKVILIAEGTNLEAVSVASYALASDDKNVRKEANLAFNQLKSDIYIDFINTHWLGQLKKIPNITSKKIIEKISKKLDIKEITVAVYATKSKISEIKTEAYRIKNQIYLSNHRIEDLWLELIKKKSNLTPIERCKIISTNISLEPITIAGAARHSKNEIIKSEANNAMGYILEAKYQITKSYLEKEKRIQNLTPKQIFETIAESLNIDPYTLCNAAIYSKNKRIKKLAGKLRDVFGEEKKNLTKIWNDCLQKYMDLTPWERCDLVANKVELSPETVSRRAKHSKDKIIAFEARISLSKLDNQGIFNKEFQDILVMVLRIINNEIQARVTTISTAMVLKKIKKLKNYDNNLRNLCSYCLRILKNFKIIDKTQNTKPFEYSLPDNEINTDEFLHKFETERDYRKIFKGIRETY